MNIDDEEITFAPFNLIEELTTDELLKLLYRFLEREELTGFLDLVRDIVDYYSPRRVAEKTGLTRENLYKILRGDRDPSLQTVHKIIWALKSGALNHPHHATSSKSRQQTPVKSAPARTNRAEHQTNRLTPL